MHSYTMAYWRNMCSCQQDVIKKLKQENEELKNKLNELYEYCDNYCEGERLYEYSNNKED